MKHNVKRKGFTLVELLIVIVVIGILSAMMMMSSTEAVTSAKASNVVSNMRNLKTAALALYTDNLDKYSKSDATIPSRDLVFKYLNSGVNIPDSKDYGIVAAGQTFNPDNPSTGKGSWFLAYKINGTADEIKRIKTKLAGRAASIGLLNAASTDAGGVYTNDDVVYLYVR